MSMSMTYRQNQLVLIVPPGHVESQIMKLLEPFDAAVWGVIGIMLMVIVIIILIVRSHSRKVQDFVFGRRNRTPFLGVINIMIGTPVHPLPGRNFSRWNLIMFIILWLILRNLYQAILYKDLQKVVRNLPVQTIEETLRLGFVYYMLPSTQENLIYFPEVYKRKVVLRQNTSYEVLVNLFNDPKSRVGFPAALDTVHYSNKKNIYGFTLNLCPQPLLSRQYGIVFPKGSFLVSSFDNQLIMFMESGLIDYWLSKQTKSTTSAGPKVFQPMKLSLNHLVSAFQLLLFGVSLACIAFAAERLSSKSARFRRSPSFRRVNKTSTAPAAFQLNIQ